MSVLARERYKEFARKLLTLPFTAVGLRAMGDFFALLKDPYPAAQTGITSLCSVIPISATGILAKLYIVVPTIFYTYKFYYKLA